MINGWGKDWAVMFGGDNGSRWWTKLFSFTAFSNLSVNFCWVSIWILKSWMSLWISCIYCSLFSAQLCSRLLSRCWPKSGGGYTKVFQSNRKGILVPWSSRYLSSRLFGKFLGNVVIGFWPVADSVDGSERFSGNDKDFMMKCLWVRLPCLVHLGKSFVSSNVGVCDKMGW